MTMSSVNKTVDEKYFQHAARITLARRIGALARHRLHDFFMQSMKPTPDDRILDIGVSDDTGIGMNMLEQLYPWRQNLICAGLSDGEAITTAYPGVRHIKIIPGEPLPFADNEFSISFSCAVLEHVGSQAQQRKFLAEMCRVAPARFLAVPNPSFPVEHHTCLPLIHYLPKPWFRALLKNTRYDFWSREENLNYLSRADLKLLWPGSTPPVIAFTGIGFGPFKSNLVAYQTLR